jgi:hypothetical protein
MGSTINLRLFSSLLFFSFSLPKTGGEKTKISHMDNEIRMKVTIVSQQFPSLIIGFSFAFKY